MTKGNFCAIHALWVKFLDKERRMALAAHLEELSNKHAKIDETIHKEMKYPAPDTVRITALKKQKLQIKQKIALYNAQ